MVVHAVRHMKASKRTRKADIGTKSRRFLEKELKTAILYQCSQGFSMMVTSVLPDGMWNI